MEQHQTEPLADDNAEADASKTERTTSSQSQLGIKVLVGPDSDIGYDVVAVHGLLGDREGTWSSNTSENAIGKGWLEEKLFAQHPTARISLFGYESKTLAASSSARNGIRNEAMKLLNALTRLRNSLDKEKRCPIVFVAQDVGGIIVKQALIIASLHYEEFGDISGSTRVLIFFGCPHRTSSIHDLESKLARLLVKETLPPSTHLSWACKDLAEAISETNGAFLDTKILLSAALINLYSTDTDPANLVFDKFTVTMDIAHELRYACANAHGNLSTVFGTSDLYSEIDYVLSDPGLPWEFDISLSTQMEDNIHIIQSQAPPISALRTTSDSAHRFSWLGENETFQHWVKQPGSRVLHVYGSADVTSASEFIFRFFDELRMEKKINANVMYYRFRNNDNRFSSISAMVSTFISQLMRSDWWLSVCSRNFNKLRLFRTWTDNDLLSFFDDAQNFLRWDRSTIYVIDGMDQSDISKRRFLSEISRNSEHSEMNSKIVILSTNSVEMQASLSNHPSINLDEQAPLIEKFVESDLDGNPYLTHLLLERPQFLNFEQQLRHIAKGCGLDHYLSRLTLEWLRFEKSLSTQRAIERELKRLSPVLPSKVFKGIMDAIPSQKQKWAREVLMWVLHSFRPLTIWELGEALSLMELAAEAPLAFDAVQDLSRQIRDCFGPLVLVEDNEIRFAHPCASSFFLNPNSVDTRAWYAFSKQDINHREITDLCLRYLSFQESEEKMILLSNPQKTRIRVPVFENRCNFFSYAVRHWPRHFKLGYSSECDAKFEATSEFVHSKQAIRTWNEVNWHFSNPISRTDRSFMSSLPVFSAHGLTTLVSRQILELAGSTVGAIDICLALVEAARAGHSDIIRLLLQDGQFDHATLQNALTAATSSGDELVLTELLQYSAKIPHFEWPSILLPRAASLGLNDTGNFLLEFGARVDSDALAPTFSPLRLAVERNHPDFVKILLSNNATLTTRGSRDATFLHVAARCGWVDVAKLLIEAGAGLDDKDVDDSTPLQSALASGKHAIVKGLINAGADVRSIGEGDEPVVFVQAALCGFFTCLNVILQYRGELVPQGLKEAALIQASGEGYVDVCRLLLQHGTDPNGSVDEEYALVQAVKSRNLELVKLLLKHGAKLDLGVGSENGPALSVAAKLGLKDITDLLIQEGAGVNDVDAEGCTPLYFAAQAGHHEIVQILLCANAEVNKPSKARFSPLVAAYKYPEVIRILLDGGADMDRLGGPATVLHVAAYHNEIDTIRLLISRHANLEIKIDGKSLADEGFTALLEASWQGHVPAVRFLLDAGADINATSAVGTSSLHYALQKSNHDVMRALMDYNPALDMRDLGGYTPLHWVAENTPISNVKVLLDRGANLEVSNNLGYTPLCAAVTAKNVAVAKYLISRKAKINGVDGQKGGPLHLACRTANLELVKAFVEGGADTNVPAPSMEGSPLQSACWWQGSKDDQGLEQIIRYLVEEAKCDVDGSGGTCGCVVSTACLRSPTGTAKYLINHGAQLTIQDTMGRLPVHYASLRTLDHLTTLLGDLAVPPTKDKLGSTALHYAVTSGQVDVVQYVLSHSNISVNTPDFDGWTPLFWALRPVGDCRRESHNQVADVIRLLVDRGAELWVRGKGWDREWSPLKLARYYGASGEVVKLLTPKVKRRVIGGVKEKWDSKFHLSRKAKSTSGGFCDGCLMSLQGSWFLCSVCTSIGFALCFKCYRSSNTLHPDHSFDEVGPEYEGEEEGANKQVCEEEIEEIHQDDEEDDGDWSEDESPAVGEQEDSAGESEVSVK